jgi:GNAT superfamily N-acetyltransferase
MAYTPENIKKIARQYKEHSIFEPDLWIFAKDNFEDKIAGITISSFNRELSETQVDWFYILPQFHGKGIGRFLLKETVSRSKNRSKIIHAPGDEFYKKCGFVETHYDAWAEKEGYEFIASCVQPNVLP